MQIRDIMTHRVRSISAESTLREAAQTMASLEVGALPVCRENESRPIGLITDRDITVRAVAEGRDPEVSRVEDIMTPGLIYCYDDENIEDAITLMEARQIRRLPVMNQRDQLIGIVTLADLATRQTNMQMSGEVLQHVSLPASLDASVWKTPTEVNREIPYHPA